jgi:predicted kinase
MCGVSGSGKSWLAERLVPRVDAIRIRSDIVRQQMAGIERTQSSDSRPDSGIYAPFIVETVYARLLELTQALLDVGENIIVDATFLSSANRAAFQTLAVRHGHECVVIQCDAPAHVLKRRIEQRLRAGRDPSEATPAVLERQLQRFEPPGADERVIRVQTDQDLDVMSIIARLNRA